MGQVQQTQKLNIVGAYRTEVSNLLHAMERLDTLLLEWTQLGYTAGLTDADLTGSVHDGLKAQDILDAATAMAAVKTTVTTGTNQQKLYKIMV